MIEWLNNHPISQFVYMFPIFFVIFLFLICLLEGRLKYILIILNPLVWLGFIFGLIYISLGEGFIFAEDIIEKIFKKE